MPGEDGGQGDFFQDGDEEEEEELEMFDESIDRFELSGWRPRRLCCDVTTWQTAVHAGGAARLRMASKRFTRHPFLEHFVDLPVLQVMDEVDAAVKGSGEGGGRGGAQAKVAAARVQLCSRCSSLALQGVRRSSAEDGGTQALAARRWGGGFPRRASHR